MSPTEVPGREVSGRTTTPVHHERVPDAGWFDAGLGRSGITTRFGRDLLLAVVVAVVTVALLTVVWSIAPDRELDTARVAFGWILAIACAQAVALCLRRVAPWWCLAAVVTCQVGLAAAAPDLMLRGLAPFVVAYTIGTVFTPRRTLVAGVAAVTVEAAAGVVVLVRGADEVALGLANLVAASTLGYVVAASVGIHVATRRRNLRLVQAEARAAVTEHAARVQAALVGERARIARELHDVAAHHLSGMVVQAAAVQRLVDRDPAAAREGAAWLRAHGKQTLDNLRSVVGLLRDAGSDDVSAPLPGLDTLEDLVAAACELGDEVVLVREGEPVRLSPVADVALYRLVQQALTNARQHAPGAPVSVRVAYGRDDVVIEVVNGPCSRPASHDARGGVGLVVMRERAELLGAQLHVGATEEGGWRVWLRLSGTDAADEHDGGGA